VTTDFLEEICKGLKGSGLADQYTSKAEIKEVLKIRKREPGYKCLERDGKHVPAELYYTVIGEWDFVTRDIYPNIKRAFGRELCLRDCRTHQFVKDVREWIRMTTGMRVGTDLFLKILSREGVVAPVDPRHPVVWVDPEDKGAFVVPEAYPDERLWKDQEELALGGAECVEGEDLGIVIGTELEIPLEDFSSV
jgi:hypothetical protein